MSIQNHRLPLGEFTSSRINKLALVGGNIFKPVMSSTTTLPSIKSLMNHNSMEIAPIRATSMRSEPIAPLHPFKRDTRDYSTLSRKLQVRLQFAYYKYKTQQTDMKFTELKLQKAKRALANTKHSTKSLVKRRKLVVSQGNYRTPSKGTTRYRNIDETFSASKSYNTCVDSTSNTSASSNVPTHKSNNDTTVINLTTTPSRNKLALYPKQETPMSVKAAKSLIHLFTSSNHF